MATLKKGSMSLSGTDQAAPETLNVVSLFRDVQTDLVMNDPMIDLIEEALIEEIELEEETKALLSPRTVVSEEQFPDQSMYILEGQLKNLRKSLNRLKFYMGELDDILPH